MNSHKVACLLVYGQRRFKEGIDEIDRVFAFCPTSNKVSASLLKNGVSLTFSCNPCEISYAHNVN